MANHKDGHNPAFKDLSGFDCPGEFSFFDVGVKRVNCYANSWRGLLPLFALQCG
jgi:hypothetical protein